MKAAVLGSECNLASTYKRHSELEVSAAPTVRGGGRNLVDSHLRLLEHVCDLAGPLPGALFANIFHTLLQGSVLKKAVGR
jgi:hypothetical protein